VKALSAAGYGYHKSWAQNGSGWALKVFPNPCPKGRKIAKPGDPAPDAFGSGQGNGAGTPPPGSGTDGSQDLGGEKGPFCSLSDEDLGLIPLISVKCRPIRWLWKYRLQQGAMALMVGDGGLGKSQLQLMIAAKVSTAGECPDGSGRAPLGNVIIVSAEDQPEDTIKPRLIALGADLSRITLSKAKYVIRKPDKEPVVNPTTFQDRGYWKETFRRRPECSLFIVDPLPSYLGRGVNDSKNSEIRAILEPFIDQIIAPAGVVMLANTHMNKNIDAKMPMHRITGSIAYGNLPRNVHFVVRDPEDSERRFFKQAKCNNAPDGLPGMAFRVERREIVSDDGEAIETAVPVFEAEPVAVDLGDVVNGSKKESKPGPDPKVTMKLAEWLFDFLKDRHPTPVGAVFDEAGTAGLIGKQKVNSEGRLRWSSGSVLWEARKRVVGLPEPRNGKRVDDLKTPVRDGGKAVLHWYLADEGAVF
jgi:hypothetical protein